MEAVIVLLLLLLPVSPTKGATWCVCRSDVSDAALQKTLDYACGAGADCSPILQNGPCFQPNTVRSHCTYAANSFFQRKGQVAGSCDFTGTASISTTDPSYGSCSYPSSGSSGSIGTTPTSTTTPSGFNNGGLGLGTGTGSGLTPDMTSGMSGGALLKVGRGFLSMSLTLAGFILIRNLF